MLFQEIAWLLLGASALGLLGIYLRQPVIVSFIAVGIVVAALGDATEETAMQIEFLAELGIALLLFLVGLKLDIGLVRTLGPVALATGLGQVVFTAVIGFLICLALGLDVVTSAYIAVALTFSSTIIIVKLLTDKRELETLHGRIALGFLIVQDIVVVLAMVTLSVIGVGGTEEGGIEAIFFVLGAMAAMLVGLALFIRYVADWVMSRVARSAELLVIFAIGWAASAAALGDIVGFGKELGGLVAGVSLGSTQFREMISSRLASLRDFLLLFFFVALGAHLDLGQIGDEIGPAIVLSLFVLIGNPLIVLIIMAAMGYRTRTGFLAGLTVAQISEFSLIFMGMGLAMGHIASGALGLVTLVGLVTIALSVYMITYSHQLYPLVQPALRWFEGSAWRERAVPDKEEPPVDVILFGLGRFGSQLFHRLEDEGYEVLGIDLDPRVVHAHRMLGRRVRYGDAADQEFWAELPLGQARWVILAVPSYLLGLTHADTHGSMLSAVRTHKFHGSIALIARNEEEKKRMEEAGVHLVLLPFAAAADTGVRELVALDQQ